MKAAGVNTRLRAACGKSSLWHLRSAAYVAEAAVEPSPRPSPASEDGVTDKVPSPCIDVCKYRNKGHCIACSMTKLQKKAFKRLKGSTERRAFLTMLVAQQTVLGRYAAWATAYRRKCDRKGVTPPV